MKIVEGLEEILKVYLIDRLDIGDTIFIEGEGWDEPLSLTPLEADRLADLLKSICNKTKYFKGLKKE